MAEKEEDPVARRLKSILVAVINSQLATLSALSMCAIESGVREKFVEETTLSVRYLRDALEELKNDG